MKNIRFLTLAAAGLLALTLMCSSSAMGSGQTSPRRVPSVSSLELEAGRLVNAERRARGLPQLTMDAAISAKARLKSRDMLQGGYFSHTSPTYGSPFSMMRSLGISYVSAGENIAMGFHGPADVVAAWMTSKSHRDNLLSASYTTMGIGYADGYWTQWLLRTE